MDGEPLPCRSGFIHTFTRFRAPIGNFCGLEVRQTKNNTSNMLIFTRFLSRVIILARIAGTERRMATNQYKQYK